MNKYRKGGGGWEKGELQLKGKNRGIPVVGLGWRGDGSALRRWVRDQGGTKLMGYINHQFVFIPHLCYISFGTLSWSHWAHAGHQSSAGLHPQPRCIFSRTWETHPGATRLVEDISHQLLIAPSMLHLLWAQGAVSWSHQAHGGVNNYQLVFPPAVLPL